jgi:hypothetical protein
MSIMSTCSEALARPRLSTFVSVRHWLLSCGNDWSGAPRVPVPQAQPGPVGLIHDSYR